MSQGHSYADRFGYTWSVRARKSKSADAPYEIVFTSGELRMVAEGDGPLGGIRTEDLKEIFCDAEREFESDGETWYVGYRQRSGTRATGRHTGLCTRFRSASGEIRYAREMLHFRHMAADMLCAHLGRARGAVATAGGTGRRAG